MPQRRLCLRLRRPALSHEHTEVRGAMIRIHTMCDAHVHALEAVTQRREQNVGGVSKVVMQTVSSALGAGAAAIDVLRMDKTPKDLRDDCVALSLAYIGNLMLHTSALTLGDAEIAAIAQINLSDHASAMLSLQRIIPAATVATLVAHGMTVDPAELATVAKTVDAAWRG